MEIKKFIKEILPYVIILVVVILVRTFVFSTIRVNGDSMYDTLHDKDIMILNKMKYRFSDVKRFDIVVVENDNNKLIKRVIGLPNEKIEYKENVLYVDGKEIKDKYNEIKQEDFEITLGKNEYFVMGDNRGDSLDSRLIGPIKKEQILGYANFTILPFDRWGSAK